VSPVKYELGFYIPEDGILHSHCREILKSYKLLCAISGNVSRLYRVTSHLKDEGLLERER
jgi:glutaminase